jgi:membrane protease YdiL (CAAX protease family)
MPVPINAFATALEFTLVVAGALLLWRFALSPLARATVQVSPLASWESPLSDFLLFLWLAVSGGLVGPTVAQLTARFLGLSDEIKLVFVNAGFQGGMLAGMAAYYLLVNRRAPRPVFGFGSALLSGGTTFLVSLPLIVVVGLVWVGLLKLCGLPVDPQDAVSIFKNAKSPGLIAAMIVLAAAIAPLTEELVFRAGIFRYARNRLPRWAALLAPACCFAALHNHLPSFAPLVALGVVFSLAYERTGWIGTPIIAHALFNSYSIVRIFIDPRSS